MAKILIVAHPFSVHSRVRGIVGMEEGHQIYWVSTPKVNLPHVVAYGPPASTGSLGRWFLEPLILASAIHQVRPDVIHVHYAWQALRIPILLRQSPLIVTTMGSDILPWRANKGWRKPLIRRLLDHADIITTKSIYMDKALNKIGDYQKKIRRVTWGIDLNTFRPDKDVNYLRDYWKIPSLDLVFFDARAARPVYNKHIVLEAFAKYLQLSCPPTTLLVAAGNSGNFTSNKYLGQLKKQAQELGIFDKVKFVGMIEHTAMADYFALADITISVPSSDGLPQTIYEALGCGSFLVISDLPQYEGVVQDGITARLVPVGDSQALGEALASSIAIIKNRSQDVQSGRAYVIRHADKVTQNQFVNQIYLELLEKP